MGNSEDLDKLKKQEDEWNTLSNKWDTLTNKWNNLNNEWDMLSHERKDTQKKMRDARERFNIQNDRNGNERFKENGGSFRSEKSSTFSNKSNIIFEEKVNPFETLGISTSSTEVEIISAFRKLAMENHPDKGGDPSKFIELVTAKNRCLSYIKER
jgi:DnaJ-domain-containing protein 1